MQSSELPFLKQARPWYKNIHSTVLQQNLRRLKTAFQNFFDGKGYPKFKTRQRFKSFSYPPNQVKLELNKIYLPSIGWMRFFKSRNIPDGFQLKTVTVRSLADDWYVSIRIENKHVPQLKPKDLEQVRNAPPLSTAAFQQELKSCWNAAAHSTPLIQFKVGRRSKLLLAVTWVSRNC